MNKNTQDSVCTVGKPDIPDAAPSCDTEPLGFPHIRAASIHLENHIIGDGAFVPEIAATLREYADMIEQGVAGWETAETFVSKGGTRLFIIGAAWRGHRLPRKLSDRPW